MLSMRLESSGVGVDFLPTTTLAAWTASSPATAWSHWLAMLMAM